MIVEAMCCGTPVVAPAVGGIPEIVAGLGSAELEPELNRSCIEEATGLLKEVANNRGVTHFVAKRLNLQRTPAPESSGETPPSDVPAEDA